MLLLLLLLSAATSSSLRSHRTRRGTNPELRVVDNFWWSVQGQTEIWNESVPVSPIKLLEYWNGLNLGGGNSGGDLT